jgi:ABC-2 type transport system permease protein
VLGMMVSFFTGFIYVLPLASMEHHNSGLWMYYTMFLFLLSLMLITDFSTVLIDTRDKYIVLPQPVNDRTLFLSRMLHIFIYLFRIVLPMSLPGWISVGLIFGWKAAVWFPVPLLLLVFIALFVVIAVYLIMLRIASAEKFKETLSYFQIAFSIVLFAFYLIPRTMDAAVLRQFDITHHIWAPATPPYWLAATYSWIAPLTEDHPLIPYLGLLAFALPALCLWATVKFLAPQFAARLGGLDAIESGETNRTQQISQKGAGFYGRLAHLLNRRPEAQAGFIMAWIQTARSRTFKMKVYPMFAYVPIYFVYLMLQSRRPLREVWAELPHSGKHIILLYMCSIVMLQAFAFMGISEQYKAAWIYRAMPLKEPGAIMAGSFKVVWVKFFLPFFAAISVFVLAVWGLPAISDVLLALVNVTLFAACVARVSYRRFPFSKIDQAASSGSKFLRSLIGMLIPAALGVCHYFALHMLWLKCLFLVLSSILLWLVWDSYAHTDWAVIKSDDEEG